MRVLITGAGGFIGRHLTADQLARGHVVTAVDLHVDALQRLADNPNLTVVAADFTDADRLDPLLPGHDVCFHLASAHLETGVDDDYFWRVNVAGSRSLVERCHRAGIGRFVHCSSVGVYGDIRQPPADETTECRPDIAYERSKLAGERAIQDYVRGTGYPLVILRPAWVYGPGCPRTGKLFRSIEKGRFFFVGDGRSLRHPIYIADMVRAFDVAARHPDAIGDLFIIAGPRAVTLRELTEAIAGVAGAPPPRRRLPLLLVWPAVYLMELAGRLLGRSMPFSRRSLKFFTGNTAFRTGKAERILGYQATVDLVDGLQQTYAGLQREAGR